MRIPGFTARSKASLTQTGKDDLLVSPPRRDRRLIVSFPKSGRTWLGFALSKCGVDATFTHAGVSTNRREIGQPFSGIPLALRDVPVIFLHRDPIDTAVSLFYQISRRDLRPWSLRWVRMSWRLWITGALPPTDIDSFVLHPRHGVEKISAYNRAWIDHLAGRTDCLVLTYEAMRANPGVGFQQILDFIGDISVTGLQLAEASSFDQMKAVERAQSQTIDPDGVKVRRGKVKGYVDELRPETVLQCQAIAARYGFVD
jgi:hypothetical protein